MMMMACSVAVRDDPLPFLLATDWTPTHLHTINCIYLQTHCYLKGIFLNTTKIIRQIFVAASSFYVKLSLNPHKHSRLLLEHVEVFEMEHCNSDDYSPLKMKESKTVTTPQPCDSPLLLRL